MRMQKSRLQLRRRPKPLAIHMPCRKLKGQLLLRKRPRRQLELSRPNRRHPHLRTPAVIQRQRMQQIRRPANATHVSSERLSQACNSLKCSKIVCSAFSSAVSNRPPRSLPSTRPGTPLPLKKRIQHPSPSARNRRAVGMRRQQIVSMHRDQQPRVRVLVRDDPHRALPHRQVLREVDLLKRGILAHQARWKTPKASPARVIEGCASRAAQPSSWQAMPFSTRARGSGLRNCALPQAVANAPARRAWSGCVINHQPVCRLHA